MLQNLNIFTYRMENVTITFITKPVSSDTVWYVSVIELGIFSDIIQTNYRKWQEFHDEKTCVVFADF